MASKTPPHERPDEVLGVRWQPKPWLNQHDVSSRAASRAADMSDTSVHLWDQAGVVPLSFWKLCWYTFAPTERPPAPKIVRVELPFKVTGAMLDGAAQFDAQFPGLAPTVRESVVRVNTARPKAVKGRRPQARHLQVRETASSPYAAERPTPTPRIPRRVSEPLTLHVEPTPTPAPIAPSLRESSGEVEVLLALLVQITAQRDQLTHRVYLLETQRRSEDQLRARIAELERELAAFKDLADAATAPGASTVLPPRVEPRAAERVEKLLQGRAPGLIEELRNLPRQVVVS